MDKDYLVLKRASACRPSGEWNDDDFDVLADGAVVGRVMKAALTSAMSLALAVGVMSQAALARFDASEKDSLTGKRVAKRAGLSRDVL